MMRKFIRYYRPHLPLFTLDFGCALITALMDLVFPFVVRLMIDEVIPSRNLNLIFMISGGLLIFFIIRSLLQYIVDYWGHVLGIRMEYHMRKDLFQHLQKLSFNYFDNTRTGHVMSRLVNDLNEISELAHHGPEDLFIALVTLTGSFLIMLSIHWQLTLITFMLIPVVMTFTILKNKRMQEAFRNMRRKLADINAQVEDSISGVRVVKSFTNEAYEEEKFKEGNDGFRLSKEKALKVMAEFFAGVNFFTNAINLLVITFGGLFIYQGTMTLGEMVGFLLYVSMFLQPMRKLTILVENYQKGMAGFHRFVETLELEPDIKDDPDAMEMTEAAGEIEFHDVTFSYNNREHVLNHISFRVSPGETVALVGPSGGGKTTLCHLIPRFYEVETGAITIDQRDIRSYTQASLRRNIGIVQQDVFLFSGTVRENIAYANLNASEDDIIMAARLANAHEFITGLEKGYDTYIGERGVMLSGGQKQRLSIARMFLKNPPILILDEATSALDNETEKLIQQSLAALSKQRTTLVIAHRLATIKNADRIMVLTDEGIVEEGTHETLMKQQGMYARLYEAQFSQIPTVVA
ncbi:ABC transporter ATP-binding protein [Anoxynatronum buryatiense]|uniref:ATP-binding cassette, subfamily B n=1 Tax=Anoxynatronum buryatiense TaxID=489973 RepID=A0AA45WTU5_9CLOT|nr:ABC transporter ATP-binding protein [Anoxynatronum buryatiense]SMP44195.1 ATP-binding cassette, subfamily B [Anoxynatronum buryatiense]